MNPTPSASSLLPAVRALALLLAAPVAALVAQTPAADPFAGHWQGKVTVQGTTLELALHVEKHGDAYTATLDSLSQGAEGIPVATFTVDGETCKADVKAIGGMLALRLQKGTPDHLVGELVQRGVAMPTDLARVSEVQKPKRPQEPKPPFPYRSEDVTYHHDPARSLTESFGTGESKEGVTLAGTLTLPEGKGPFPAAVMITGSGAQDRDETLLGHKPFLVIADALTRAGLAVLRVDDRGTGKSTGSFADATSADFARDALAGVRYLKTRSEIDPTRIGLIGHSEGGIVAPMVAAGEGKSEVAFAVLIAPPGVSLGEVIVHQSRLIAKAEGADENDRAADDQLMQAVVRIVASDAAPEERKKQLGEAIARAWEAMSETARKEAGGSLESLQKQTERMDSPWMRFLVVRDPAVDLKAMTCPTLALFGGKDLQVDPAQNEPPLRAAIEASGKAKSTIVVLPEHNHLFQHTKTGKPSEYATNEETFSEVAIAVIREWIGKNVLADRK